MSALSKSLRVLGPALLVFTAAWLIVRFVLPSGREPRTLSVLVRDDGGGALAEVLVLVDQQVRGVSDAQGALRIARTGEGTLQVAVRCPEAYRAAPVQRILPARAFVRFVCRPKLRTLAVVVHAPSAAGQLLRADAQSLGRIDSEGVLHAVLRRAPGSRLTLSLAEGGARQELVVEDRDRIVLFEPTPRERR